MSAFFSFALQSRQSARGHIPLSVYPVVLAPAVAAGTKLLALRAENLSGNFGKGAIEMRRGFSTD